MQAEWARKHCIGPKTATSQIVGGLASALAVFHLRHCIMTASKNGNQTPGKRGKPFERGNPGGPGRRDGSRNAATLLLDKLAEGDGEEILRKTLEDAKGGDANARKLVLDRVWPIRKG